MPIFSQIGDGPVTPMVHSLMHPLLRHLVNFQQFSTMAEGRSEEFQLDKPFWYHKWVTVRKADFCSECGKAGPKAGTTNAPKLKQCSKCKSVSYVSINSLLVLLIFFNMSKISFPTTTVQRSVSERALEEGTQEKVQEAR